MDAAALIQALTERFPDAVRSSHAYRGDATIVVSREALLDLARALKGDAAFQMNFLMDLTAVDFSTFGKKPSSAFFASSGVAVRPSAELPDEHPWPALHLRRPSASIRFTSVGTCCRAAG